MDMRENVALAPLTTLGVGGPARWFVEAASEAEVLEAVRWAQQRGLPVFVLGGGSNLLVADEGFAGLVLRVALKGVEAVQVGGERVFRVAAGESWDGFVQRAVEEDCAGVECMAGIPGTVGGTPVQNVGAYGQEVAETIERVGVIDLDRLECVEMTAAECGFAYRSSVFHTTAKGRFFVTRVDYRLRPGGEPCLRYADLLKEFAEIANPSLAEVADGVRRIRQAKGMLLVQGDEDSRSAGSFFKNPIVKEAEWAALEMRLGRAVPHYPAELGADGRARVKLPAAWLIEQAGFKKGFALGRAGISSRHTLALVNRGGASAGDMLALRDLIFGEVQSRFGLELEMEPVLVGF